MEREERDREGRVVATKVFRILQSDLAVPEGGVGVGWVKGGGAGDVRNPPGIQTPASQEGGRGLVYAPRRVLHIL